MYSRPMKRNREISSGGKVLSNLSSQSPNSTREIRKRSGKVSRWDIRSCDVSTREIRSGGDDLDVSREEIRTGGDVSTREIRRSGKVSRWDIRSCDVSTREIRSGGDDLDVSREEIRTGGNVSTREVKSGTVSRDIRSCDVQNFVVSREDTREVCYLDVLREEIRSGDDVSTREIRGGDDLTNQSIDLLLTAMRNCDVPLKPLLSPPRKRREREIHSLEVPRRDIKNGDDVERNLSSHSMNGYVSGFRSKGSKGEITESDLQTDTVFSNLLLSRHHRALGANNEHGIIAVPRVSSRLLDDAGILCEILSRLPVRSLLRFKSVCKRWLSLIKHDRHFINLHFTRLQSHPNILCITPLQKKICGWDGHWFRPSIKTPRQCIFLADVSSVEGGSSSSIDDEEKVPAEAIIRDVRMTTDDDGFVYDQVLKPVNGLICFVDWIAAAVRIYNVSTREVTPWIKSTLLEEEKNRFEKEDGTIEIKIDSPGFPVFQLGFDPSTMEHKVFCFWTLSRTQLFLGDPSGSQIYACSEALSIGRDTKWRRIHVVPSEDNQMKLDEVVVPLNDESWHVYVNGTIYWYRFSKNHGRRVCECSNYYMIHEEYHNPKVLVAFDVGSEKFRVIPIPDFILDEPREESFFSPIAMLELNGRVALSYRLSPYLLKLWVLDDGVDKKIENCHGNGKNWSAETIKLPFRYDPSDIKFQAVPGTDQVVFECYDDAQRNLKLVSLYAYDRKRQIFKKIEIDGVSFFPLHYSSSFFTTFTESLYSVA